MLRDMLCKDSKKISMTKEMMLLDEARKYKKIALFGGGIAGKWALDWCTNNEIKVDIICDNNSDKYGSNIDGIYIYNPKTLVDFLAEWYVIISCDAHNVIKKQLLDMGMKEKQIGFFDKLWIDHFDWNLFVEENMTALERVYEMCADQKSKDVYCGLLNYKISGNQEFIKEITDPHEDMYFDKELVLSLKHETFIDVGAYIGDTLREYKKKYGYMCKNYFCFEPNQTNLQSLTKYVQDEEEKNVIIINKGVSDKKKTLSFKIDSGAATRVTNDGNGDIDLECTSIDQELIEWNLHGTSIIKMDIEGSELDALIGSKKFIKKNHPILEICVYHKPQDIFELPIFIHNTFSGYKLYFRHYELSVNETVCYAIPE